MREPALEAGDGRAGEPVEIRHLPVPAAPLVSGSTPRSGVPAPLEPAGPRTVASLRASGVPTPLVAAAGGFLAGLATWALSRLIRPRRRGLVIRRASRGGRPLQIAGTRSFLVDVHLIRR